MIIVCLVTSIVRASPSVTGARRRDIAAGSSAAVLSLHDVGGNTWARIKDGEFVLVQAQDGTKYADIIPAIPAEQDDAAAIVAGLQALARIWRAK
jgi:hypothetical protein